jgi:hypothetical protein
VLAGLQQGLQIPVTSLLMIDAIVSSFEATRVSLTCLDRTVVLCLSMNFPLVAVQVWFVSEGAVVAGWIVACDAPVPFFGA